MPDIKLVLVKGDGCELLRFKAARRAHETRTVVLRAALVAGSQRVKNL